MSIPFAPGQRFRPAGTAFVVGACTFVERHPDGSGVLYIDLRVSGLADLRGRLRAAFTRDGDDSSIDASPWTNMEREP